MLRSDLLVYWLPKNVSPVFVVRDGGRGFIGAPLLMLWRFGAGGCGRLGIVRVNHCSVVIFIRRAFLYMLHYLSFRFAFLY